MYQTVECVWLGRSSRVVLYYLALGFAWHQTGGTTAGFQPDFHSTAASNVQRRQIAVALSHRRHSVTHICILLANEWLRHIQVQAWLHGHAEILRRCTLLSIA